MGEERRKKERASFSHIFSHLITSAKNDDDMQCLSLLGKQKKKRQIIQFRHGHFFQHGQHHGSRSIRFDGLSQDNLDHRQTVSIRQMMIISCTIIYRHLSYTQWQQIVDFGLVFLIVSVHKDQPSFEWSNNQKAVIKEV